MLFNPSEAEVAHHCAQSVIEIRHILSESLAKLGGTGVLADHLRALGAAARRFLDRTGQWQEDDYAAVGSWGHYRSWEFLDALGQMRGLFGVHIAMIAARYGLDVKGDLATILPVETRTDEFKRMGVA